MAAQCFAEQFWGIEQEALRSIETDFELEISHLFLKLCSAFAFAPAQARFPSSAAPNLNARRLNQGSIDFH